VEKGVFRKDLYYRLFTHRIHIPALRERREDIPLLLEWFLEKSSTELGRKIPQVPTQLYTLLATYEFPGNVRELESMVFDAVSRHEAGTLSMSSFREKMDRVQGRQGGGREPEGAHAAAGKLAFAGPLPTLKEAQEILIGEALKAADGNQTIAAGILGMSRRALSSRLSRRGPG